MDTDTIKKLKTAALIFYAVAIASPLLPFLNVFSEILYGIVILVAAVHLIEFFIKRRELENLNTNDNHFVQTMLYGLIHWKPLLRK